MAWGSLEGLQRRRAPTFAVLPIAGVARLADALVGFRGVLADGVDVAAVGALHALVHICKGRGGDGQSRGQGNKEHEGPWQPPSFSGIRTWIKKDQGRNFPPLLPTAAPSPDATGEGLAADRELQNSVACAPHSHSSRPKSHRPHLIGNKMQAPKVQAGASPARGESLCLQLAAS